MTKKKFNFSVDQSKHLNITNSDHVKVDMGTTTFNQPSTHEQPIDFEQLVAELFQLRQAMRQEAVESEHDIAVAEVAKAEQAAKSNDQTGVLQHLKSAGKWTLDIATKIGVPVVTQLLEKSLGLK